MEEFIKRTPSFRKESDTAITQRLIEDTLKLLGADKTIFSLGDSTHEGGDVKIYRDGSNNLALFFDADAASNAKALDVYGGAVFQNHVTIGQTTLDTTYALMVFGETRIHGKINLSSGDFHSKNDAGLEGYDDNQTNIKCGNIRVSGTDATDHIAYMQIDSNDIFCVQATGDGAGGVVDLKATVKEQLVYTPSSDIAITAAGGITVTKTIMRVAGDSGAIDITANPQIIAGTDGQVVIIQGTHDTNTVTLDDGNGLALSAQCVLAAQDNITLMYDSGDAEWIETSRTTVV